MDETSEQGDRVTAVIIQPMFFPWRGQFDLQSRADIVVVLDTVQWIKRHWYNRNLISSPNGNQWITVPVSVRNHREQAIKDVEIDNENTSWRRKMTSAIHHAYRTAPYFDQYFPEVERLVNLPWSHVAPLAEASLRFGFRALGRQVTMVRASELNVDAETPIDRLVALCKAVGANQYISGPAAKSYIGESTAFADAGINLEWIEYDYSPYPRIHPPIEQELSILDLLFNTGPDAGTFL
jgi:hypothetical protein